MAFLNSAQEPERLRGPQHDGAWADELAAWARPQAVWDQLQFGLRLGPDPRCVVTTTPKPIPLLRQPVSDPTAVVSRGSTFDNKANMPAAFVERIIWRFEGARLGRQELHAELRRPRRPLAARNDRRLPRHGRAGSPADRGRGRPVGIQRRR